MLAVVIGYLLNANRIDRKEHRVERQEWDARFKAQQERFDQESEAHDRQLSELRDRLDDLEKELRSERLRADRAETQLAAAGVRRRP